MLAPSFASLAPLSQTWDVVVYADSDGDGYSDAAETAMGKDPLAYCAVMRADVSMDGKVNLLDLGATANRYGQSIPPAPARYDQNRDAKLNLLDLGAQAAVFGQNVNGCP